jgi:hypothetical protein
VYKHSDETFEKFVQKKKKSHVLTEKEMRLKERDNKRKHKHQTRNPLPES